MTRIQEITAPRQLRSRAWGASPLGSHEPQGLPTKWAAQDYRTSVLRPQTCLGDDDDDEDDDEEDDGDGGDDTSQDRLTTWPPPTRGFSVENGGLQTSVLLP